MERFEFDNSKTFGSNSNRKNGTTMRGVIGVLPWLAPVGDQEFVTLEIRGPAGAYRGSAVIDKATAGKLGAALLKWAGAYDDLDIKALILAQKATAGKPALYCDDCAKEKGYPYPLNSRVYGICPLCHEGERFCNENL